MSHLLQSELRVLIYNLIFKKFMTMKSSSAHQIFPHLPAPKVPGCGSVDCVCAHSLYFHSLDENCSGSKRDSQWPSHQDKLHKAILNHDMRQHEAQIKWANVINSLFRVECEEMLDEWVERGHGGEPTLGVGLIKVFHVRQAEGLGLADVVLDALRVHHARRDWAAGHSQVGLGVDLGPDS